LIKPGITGLAQIIMGHTNGMRLAQKKLRYDLFYIKNISLWLDVRIIIKTFIILMQGIKST